MQASFLEITDSPKKKNDEEFGSTVTECKERDVACRILATSLMFCYNSANNNNNNNNNL